MQSLKGALEKLLDRTGLATGVKQQTALERWSEIVGSTIAKNTDPESIDHGILTIRVTTPTWRQELYFKKNDIIKKLNQELGDETIREIRFI